MACSPPLRPWMLLSVLPLLLLLCPQPSQAQLFGLGPCPHYQTETLFTDQRIAELQGSGRYSVLLSHNPALECMSFDFIDAVRLSFNFKDTRRRDPVLESERGRYFASPTLYKRKGYLKIDMARHGVLGCNPFGLVKLAPVLFTDTYEVWSACTGLLAIHFEHVFVLVHEPVSLRTDNVTSLPTTSANSPLFDDVTSLPANSTYSLLSDDISSLSTTSTNSLPTVDIANLPTTPANSSLPITSANSSFLPSQWYNYITLNLSSVSTVASPDQLTDDEASTEDNFIDLRHGPSSLVVKRDVAGADGGLETRAERQKLAADIRDDLIARGFPRANALRLKYDTCDE